ncbi:hypothetical protein [Mycolicibacterium vinylchloridicum]|uniref:hypothetical protein n=1 Tax=Mycolicibacterium vinylchloridicum TaxID=2736928 RepID=UPI0015C938FE|nr:hypothetical protein [Mycolicibacterium vinylchloridicum]
MHHVVRRPLLAAATLTTATALALTPVTVTPPELHPAISPIRVSTQAVQLTDAWSDLFSHTTTSVTNLVVLGLGLDASYPLPSPTIPLAPVATQLLLNPLIYVAKLFNGQAGQIPAWIGAHLTEVGKVAQLFVAAVPGVVLEQIQVPFFAAQQAINSIGSSGNVLTGLLQAPAVFLDVALNNQFGLLGFTGPIGISLIFRNLLANALYTTPPAIVLPFKKASAATLRPKATTTTAPKPVAPSGTANSARLKPKAPSSAAGSKRKPAASATKNNSTGRGHGKRG